MDKEQYLVSICIPTYNRAPYLKRCLDSLVCQPEFLKENVEIVISDNASSDQTAQIVSLYSKKYRNIKYYCNNENIKDKNFPLALVRGNGVLRKLSNDTLLFTKGSLKLLCDAAQTYRETHPVLYWGNGSLKGINKGNEKHTNSLDDFLLNVSFHCTWIGAFSLWESDCLRLMDSADQCDTRLWQVWELCHLLKNNRAAIIYNDPIVNVQQVNKKNISYGLFSVFYVNFLGVLQSFHDNFSAKTFDKVERDLLFEFFLLWICQWENCSEKYQYSNSENLKKCVFECYQSKPYFAQFKRAYFKRTIKNKIKKVIQNFILK